MAKKSRKTRKQKQQLAAKRQQSPIRPGKQDTKPKTEAKTSGPDSGSPVKDDQKREISVTKEENQLLRRRIKISLTVLAIIVLIQFLVWGMVRMELIDISNLLDGIEL